MALLVFITYYTYNLSPRRYSGEVGETAATSDAANWYSLPDDKWHVWEKCGARIADNYWRPVVAISPP